MKLSILNDKRKVDSSVLEWDEHFSIAPFCPSTTAVNIMRGYVYEDTAYWGEINFNAIVDTKLLDFANIVEENAGGAEYGISHQDEQLTLNFSNEDWYKAFLLHYDWKWLVYGRDNSDNYDPSAYVFVYRVNGGWDEYETAAEAEASVDYRLNGGTRVNDQYHFPLAAFVVRNDGRLGESGAVLPVDPINRGRSYYYRDIRLRNFLTA